MRTLTSGLQRDKGTLKVPFNSRKQIVDKAVINNIHVGLVSKNDSKFKFGYRFVVEYMLDKKEMFIHWE